MSLLSAYNPIKSLWLPGVELQEPTGIIVVVGPNSSGKTLLLRDIQYYLLAGKPEFIVLQGLAAQRPGDYQPFVNELIEQRYLQQVPDSPQNYRTSVPFLIGRSPGKKHTRQAFQLKNLEKAFNEFMSERNGNNPSWFGPIGMTLVAPLPLDQRRHVGDKTQDFDYHKETPDHPLQSLLLNSEAQDRLEEESGRVFDNAVWLDISQKGLLQLRASGGPNRPSHGQTNNPLEARKYHPIENEGDGYRSYVGICLSLLLGEKPVSLIDEPELCLHPPQAHHIGRFIGRHAKEEHVTFVATHSSQVLRGILETARKITIVRMARRGRDFTGRLVSEEELRKVLRNPRTRSEAILDGVFSKGVVLVESEGDREEYRAASEAIEDHPAREVHFVPVGGTGGFAEPMRFYRSLDIPAAVIADLDAVCDTDKTVAMVKTIDPNLKGEIDSLREVAQKIKSLPPPITEEAAKQMLAELAARDWSWRDGGDNLLRRKLEELRSLLRRIQRVKDGGLEAYRDHEDIYSSLKGVIEAFRRIGIFFVPVGELEDWAAELMKDYPKGSSHSKTERAAIAAEKIRTAPNKEGDIWDFVRAVCDVLRRDGG